MDYTQASSTHIIQITVRSRFDTLGVILKDKKTNGHVVLILMCILSLDLDYGKVTGFSS